MRNKSSSHCNYCGISENELGKRLEMDHFVSRKRGGSSKRRNLVPSCLYCNRVKGNKPFKDARHDLVVRRLGWPKFNKEQVEWLRKKGFDVSPIDNGKLFFEENQ